jgi:HprK-related kinase A
LIISELSFDDLQHRLKTNGLRLRTGRFVTCARSSMHSVAAGIGQLYADYNVEEGSGFCDFYVNVEFPRNVRRWWRRQVLFSFDDQAPFAPLPFAHAFPVFEWGMNWCVSQHCHTFLIVHAAVVEKEGRALILPAPPGSGKSTLCAALATRGWRLLSDELTLIDLERGDIVPLPRPVSLKNQSIAVIKTYAPAVIMSPPVRDTMKGTVAHMKAPTDSLRRSMESAEPGWIVFPRYEAGSATQLVPMSRAKAFMQVADNAFNYSLLGETGFDVLTGIVERSGCYEFRYSELDEAIAVFDALAAAPA